MIEQRHKSEAAFYVSVSMIKRLKDMDLISEIECARICKISAEYHSTDLVIYF
jgi:hypothetical protein